MISLENILVFGMPIFYTVKRIPILRKGVTFPNPRLHKSATGYLFTDQNPQNRF